MELFEVIRERRSIRRYQERAVSQELIAQVLDAARLAPSWHDHQSWRFLVLTGENKAGVAEAVFEENPGRKGLVQAPVVIVVCGDPAESGTRDGKPYYLADVAIAFQHLCLAAWGLGLGTCWIGGFDETPLRQMLDIPAGIRIVGMTPLGYPDQEPGARPRKELAEVAYAEKWGIPFPAVAGSAGDQYPISSGSEFG